MFPSSPALFPSLGGVPPPPDGFSPEVFPLPVVVFPPVEFVVFVVFVGGVVFSLGSSSFGFVCNVHVPLILFPDELVPFSGVHNPNCSFGITAP